MHVGGIHLTEIGASKVTDQPPTGGAKSGDTQSMDSGFHAAFAKELPTKSASPARQTVAATRTQLSSAEASDALREAWQQHFGEEPREETVAVLTAQWSHETGGGRSMYNYNFGGIKGTGPSGLTVSQRTKEGWGSTERTIRDNFRAYTSATEGAHDYVSLLRRKYSGAIDAAHQGDPKSFVQELKKGGYFTGNEGAYVRSVSHRTAQLLGHEPQSISGKAPAGVVDVSNRAPSPPASLSPPSSLDAAVADAGHNAATSVGRDMGHAAALSTESPTFAWGSSPSAGHLEAFDDALSRAALRIALDTPGLARSDREENS